MALTDPVPTRVLFVEDHLIVGEVLARRLAEEPDLTVVGVVATAEALFERIRKEPIDVVVMDLLLGEEVSLGFPARLQAELPERPPRSIALTGQGKPLVVRQAIDHGFDGLVLKTEPLEELIRVLRAVAQGKPCYSTASLTLLVEARGFNPFAQLTGQETEVLRLLVEGLSVKESAKCLSVSENTIKTHRRNLMAKLDVHDAVRLTRLALAYGLVMA